MDDLILFESKIVRVVETVFVCGSAGDCFVSVTLHNSGTNPNESVQSKGRRNGPPQQKRVAGGGRR